jgi:hypothetical protein
MNIGRAYAIVRGRMNGDPEEAQGFLDSIPAGKRKEMNRQNSRARGSKRTKKPYKLGERPRRRR